jgi:arginase
MPTAPRPVQQDDFDRIFHLFDADGDGQLTRREIEDALEVLGRGISVDDRSRLLEAARPGSVDRPAFRAWMASRKDLDATADLHEIFDAIDTDGNGLVAVDELLALLVSVAGEQPDEELAALVRAADADGSGAVDFREFLRAEQVQGLDVSLAAVRALKKTVRQYAKVAQFSSLALVEVDSEIGAGTRGASFGAPALRSAALRKQAALRRADNGILSQDALMVQTENNVLLRPQKHRYAKYIDALHRVLGRTADLVAESLGKGLFPVVLAGDHSTAAGTMAGIKKAYPDRRLGVVWIDAHADIHSPYTTPSGNMHGMPLAVATQTDNPVKAINALDPETASLWEQCKRLGGDRPSLRIDDLIYVAVRDTEAAEDYLRETLRIPTITTAELRAMGPEAAARRCLEHLRDVDVIYVSFDVDALDSAISMGTGTPVPGGLSVEEARILNTTLAQDPRVCGWEMCEINPLLDTLNTMAESSLGIFEGVVDAIGGRLGAAR